MTSDSIKDSELRCRLAAKIWEYKFFRPMHYFKLLAEWLDCYQYILPEDRAVYEFTITSSKGLFFIWQFVDMLECCFTLAEQESIWQLINESSTSLTHPS